MICRKWAFLSPLLLPSAGPSRPRRGHRAASATFPVAADFQTTFVMRGGGSINAGYSSAGPRRRRFWSSPPAEDLSRLADADRGLTSKITAGEYCRGRAAGPGYAVWLLPL